MPEAPAKRSGPDGPAQDAVAEPKPLKSTLNLPQTAFPMKANLPVNEPIRLAAWQQNDLYGQIRAARAGAPRYILHDGPPYANGAIHLGHALNKTLKDFVVKTRTMAGFDAPYVPGWDCHGLPIEIKVDEQLGRKKLEMDPVEVRRACREYAQKYLELQRSQFIRMGVFGRWATPYSTMDPEYEARILETFFEFFEKGFVYKGLKPVSWCIHDRTALAEAEVEYSQHTSPSVYVRYKLSSDPAQIDARLAGRNIYTIIWTTTPWTLPASEAVAFNPEMEYEAFFSGPGQDDPVYIVEQCLLPSVIQACNLRYGKFGITNILATLKGEKLENTIFEHPFLERAIYGVTAEYVTHEAGTGAVHTAPAHGVDDFATGVRYRLPIIQYVDDAGRQVNTNDPVGSMNGQAESDDCRKIHLRGRATGQMQPYEGHTVFKSNPIIIQLLQEKGALLSDPAATVTHSYPHCWRCHNPVITRATEQWFIDMETAMTAPDGTPTTFRQRALDEIKRVSWDPRWGQERITNMVATRPDWCISRQRIWGVPIAVFLCRKCGEPLRSALVNRQIVELFLRESADAWYVHGPEEMLPAGVKCSCGHAEFRKEMDILDVWFESGASSHAVLDVDPDTMQRPGDPDPRTDLYAEGGDQHRGWFMSSLLCGIGLHNRAPFKEVATYGWTLDEQGRALSKSLGNFIDPVQVMDQLGGDIVRLWVASVDFREDVVASLPLLKRLAEEIYRKLRNTFRFLLGSLRELDPATGETHEFDLAEDGVAFEQMQPIDQYMLTRTAELTGKIRRAYEAMEFHRVYHLVNEFCNSELSAFYLDVLKDRLYTYPVRFKPGNAYQRELYTARRSAQTAIYKITDALARLTAPILSFTADEVWQALPGAAERASSVHLMLFPEAEELAGEDHAGLELEWMRLLTVRDQVLQVLELMRTQKTIGKSLEAELTLNQASTQDGFNLLKKYSYSLSELFNVSSVELKENSSSTQAGGRSHMVARSSMPKCERCWRHVADVGDDRRYPSVCLRCAEALDAIDFPTYATAANDQQLATRN